MNPSCFPLSRLAGTISCPRCNLPTSVEFGGVESLRPNYALGGLSRPDPFPTLKHGRILQTARAVGGQWFLQPHPTPSWGRGPATFFQPAAPSRSRIRRGEVTLFQLEKRWWLPGGGEGWGVRPAGTPPTKAAKRSTHPAGWHFSPGFSGHNPKIPQKWPDPSFPSSALHKYSFSVQTKPSATVLAGKEQPSPNRNAQPLAGPNVVEGGDPLQARSFNAAHCSALHTMLHIVVTSTCTV